MEDWGRESAEEKPNNFKGHKPLQAWNRSCKFQREMWVEKNCWVNVYHSIQQKAVTKIMTLLIFTLISKCLATSNCIVCLQNIWNIISVPPEDKRSVTQAARWRQKLSEISDRCSHQTPRQRWIYKPQVENQCKYARLTATALKKQSKKQLRDQNNSRPNNCLEWKSICDKIVSKKIHSNSITS